MSIVAAADGCRAGWIALLMDTDTGQIGSKTFSTASELVTLMGDSDVIAIDIPIGLSNREPRACDTLARSRLGPRRGSSVFPAPIRPLIERLRTTGDGSFTYRRACELSESITGKKISKQTWYLCRKILELDDLLLAENELREKVIEVHPEVSFAEIAGAPVVESKRTAEGARRRQSLVEEHFGSGVFDTVRRRYLKRDVADDDILDAFAVLWTAARVSTGTALRLPEDPPHDSRGLPMRIVY